MGKFEWFMIILLWATVCGLLVQVRDAVNYQTMKLMEVPEAPSPQSREPAGKPAQRTVWL